MKTSVCAKLGRRIIFFRKKHNLTQEKLSELSGIDYKYIQKIEGKNPPNLKLETIARLAKNLNVSLSKLLDI